MNYGHIELIKKIANNGLAASPRNYDIKELINPQLTISCNEVLMSLPNIRDIADPATKEGQYLRAEFVWYMSGSLYPNYISRFGSMWNRLTNQFDLREQENRSKYDLHGTINSNYGHCVFYSSPLFYMDEYLFKNNENKINSFDYVLNELDKDRDSRKAIIQYTKPYIYMNNVRDFTCTQNQHFLIRKDTLYNIVNIRSSDVIKGLSFDIPWWHFVGQCIANYFNIDYNNLFINIGSAHYYRSDDKIINSIIDNADKIKMKGLTVNNTCNHERIYTLIKEIDTYFSSFDNKYINCIYRYMDYEYLDSLLSNEKTSIHIIAKLLSSLLVTLVEDSSFNYNADKSQLIKFNNEIFDIVFTIKD